MTLIVIMQCLGPIYSAVRAQEFISLRFVKGLCSDMLFALIG